jgi:hypothetical protein
MIIKIFKMATLEMYKFSNKEALRNFILSETGYYCNKYSTVNELMLHLPREDYYRIK